MNEGKEGLAKSYGWRERKFVKLQIHSLELYSHWKNSLVSTFLILIFASFVALCYENSICDFSSKPDSGISNNFRTKFWFSRPMHST